MNQLSVLTQKWDAAQKETFGVIAMYQAQQIVTLFSGGHDSLLAAHLVCSHPLFYGAVWADTATGAGETRRFINETMSRSGWRLERGTVHPLLYESLILRYGFPSPVTHRQMYTELKAKSMSKAMTAITTRTKTKRNAVIQISGLRPQESTRRMNIVKHYHEKRSKTGHLEEIMVNPIHEFSKSERDDMIQHLGLPRNDFADTFDVSMECMCDANIRKGERELRALANPIYERITRNQEEIARLAYETQQLKIEAGSIDPSDKVYLSSVNIKKGWFLWEKIALHTAEVNDPFVLCAACIPGTRSADGTGGIDPDLELQIAKINRDQKLLQGANA